MAQSPSCGQAQAGLLITHLGSGAGRLQATFPRYGQLCSQTNWPISVQLVGGATGMIAGKEREGAFHCSLQQWPHLLAFTIEEAGPKEIKIPAAPNSREISIGKLLKLMGLNSFLISGCLFFFFFFNLTIPLLLAPPPFLTPL